jgi:glucose-1-phosphate thymidylyltransferase
VSIPVGHDSRHDSRRKGLILAGGAGTRLHPLPRVVSKQLLPVYDKPMVYYPLVTLMEAGIRTILVITTVEDEPLFRRLLGDGSAWGLDLRYAVQPEPQGLAQAYTLGRAFLARSASCLVLGDNFFHAPGFAEALRAADRRTQGATVFGCRVEDPRRYGVAAFDATGNLARIVEKPAQAPSPWAVTGIYLYDGEAPDLAAALAPSARGQYEITDLNNRYLERGRLTLERLAEGTTWFDMGTPDSLLAAGAVVQSLERREGRKIGCPEEVAFARGWIGAGDLERLARGHGDTAYARYLLGLLAGVRR